ncbi:peptidoglycan editing factor PgeF [Sporohalobacter salinus]|uniref:peptidoglycan editing factor PgeF n=1 Tax=Sporohalobacter salinus TaxID=1494606 RepID=UPI00195F6DE2|nr:peptidoglycan editing factor PgeF [Sporohalobacter salinus]MBM7624961.1 YfiH family protein [Sporohalobacter salinus]
MFELIKGENTEYYIIEEFADTGMVTHAFSTRLGGVSKADFAELNLAFHTEDEEDNIIKNRQRICNELGVDYHNIVAGEQIHSDNIEIITKNDQGRGAFEYQDSISETDALITNEADVILTSYYADCVPIIILDPVKEVAALAHGGWKGTVKKIGQKTVLKMKQEFGSHSEDILVGIGPSIGPCCYEVDDYVIDLLKQSFDYWEELVVKTGDNSWKLNLWQTNSRQLQDIGVLKENIIISEICTACNVDQFYSYRAEDGATGRMASLIKLK